MTDNRMVSHSLSNLRPPNHQSILNYCISGDLEALKTCSGLQQSVHRSFSDGQTCLIAACRNGHDKVAEYLIDECGADVEQVGVVEFESEQVEGVPPLWCAAAAGHLPVVELLVSRGADVNRTTITNSTALRAACFDGHEEVVRFLVDHGANVEIPNRHGHTCLMISCYRGHNRIVEYLLSKKARVNRRSAKGNTALHDCAESGNLSSLQLLLEHRAVMRKDEYGQSPIMSGANAAFKKVVEYLAALSDSLPCQGSDSPAISVHEKIAAYELLGASLFDRHSLVQDAIAAWFQALKLRQEVGLYPKCLVPSVPLCSCQPTVDKTPNICIENKFPSNYGTSNDGSINNNNNIKSSASNTSNSWPLVSLAAREALALTEMMRDPDRYRFMSRSDSLCSACSKVSSADIINLETEKDIQLSGVDMDATTGLYSRKTSRLQSELYFAYRMEFQRLMAQSNQSQTVSSDLTSSRPIRSARVTFIPDASVNNNHNYCVPLSVSTHSPLAPIQVSTPVDPLLAQEPTCWEAPRCRRWSVDRSRAHPNSGTLYSTLEPHWATDCLPPSTPPNRCRHCDRITVQFGRKPLRQSRGLCLPCILRSEIHDVCPSTSLLNPFNSMHHLEQEEPASGSNSSVLMDNSMARCTCCRLVPQNHPLIRRLEQCGEEAFGSVREFTDESQLTELMRNTHALSLQPLLIRLRVLGPDHPDTIYFIRYRGAIYADADNFRQCLNLWRYALELQRIFLEPLCHVSQAAFVSFAELFQFVLTNNYGGLPAVDLDPSLIVDCLELAVDNIERGMEYSFYQWYRRHPWSYTTADKEAINLMRHVVLCLHFIAMVLTNYLPNLKPIPDRKRSREVSALPATTSELSEVSAEAGASSNVANVRAASGPAASFDSSADAQTNSRMHRLISTELRDRFLKQVYRLVRLDPRVHHGHSLVHLTCSSETSTVGRFVICQFPNLAVLSLLLQLGADPNCADVHGQRPLGYMLSQRRLHPSTQAELLITLVRGGAHLDATDRNGLNALDPMFRHVLTEARCRVLEHTTLACQAARVARRAGFTACDPALRNLLPEGLLSFIELH